MVNLDPKPLKEATKIAHADLRGSTRDQVEKVNGKKNDSKVSLKDGSTESVGDTPQKNQCGVQNVEKP